MRFHKVTQAYSFSIFKLTFLLLFLVFCCLVSHAAELKPFSSDGCSLFPDSNLISKNDWCGCCFEHDTIYWRGGTEAEREMADLTLKKCVYSKTQNTLLAEAMHHGVRLGGSPYFYNWYRWGYGWSPIRTYQVLTPEEHQLAEVLLNKYYKEQKGEACPSN